MTTAEILLVHPAPWRNVQIGQGQIKVLDAKNVVVELLTLLEFVTNVTQEFAAQAAPAASL